MSGLRASEPLGGGVRASGSLGESVGLALVVWTVLLGVLFVLVVALIVVWALAKLAIGAGRVLAHLLWSGPTTTKSL